MEVGALWNKDERNFLRVGLSSNRTSIFLKGGWRGDRAKEERVRGKWGEGEQDRERGRKRKRERRERGRKRKAGPCVDSGKQWPHVSQEEATVDINLRT